jgi:multiple sugar transport system permease protein/cellobiose transport system permease protein
MLPGYHFLANLKVILTQKFARSYINSFVVSVVATIVSVNVSSMAGYAFNVYSFPLKKIIYRAILITMMIPGQITLVGYMIQMRTMHLTNTLAPLFICWFSNGFSVYWMTKYMEGALSKEMVESARIDGCNEFWVFYQIIVPCITPAITTLILLIFLWSWNQYLLPLIFITNMRLSTIPIFIQSLKDAYRTDYGAQLASLVLAIVPLIILFIIGSKSFIKGLTAGAVKG